ncbi:MAG: SDR family oxidoreductase [Novosphingopyxis baekryungensis]|nr:SDR family oxidoreductase [Novosphingopyxis baekryungensis]
MTGLTRPTTGVVITGGASGIGRASARALAEVGRPVALWDVDAALAAGVAKEIADEFGVATCSVGLDVRESERFPASIAASREALGSIGGLVHSAGVSHPVPIDELDEESWDLVLNVNLRSYALLAKALLSELRSHPGSAIVGIASINAILGNGANPAYSASKAGLLAVTRSLADGLAADGIRVNAICPGYIRTPMQDAPMANVPGLEQAYERQSMLGRMGEPEEIGRVVRFLLSEEASFITAEHVIVDGGVVPSQR